MPVKVNEYKEVEVAQIKNYMGLTKGSVVAINPSKAELEAIGKKVEQEPEYTGTLQMKDLEGKDVNVPFVRFTLYLKSEVEGLPLFRLSYTLFKNPDISSTEKVVFIDKYGNYKYVPISEKDSFNTKENSIMVKKDGTVILDGEGKPRVGLFAGSRIAMRGEKELIDFIKEYLQVKDTYVWNQDKSGFCLNSKLDECENYISKEEIQQIFTDYTKWDTFKVIKSSIKTNKINFIVGNKTSDNKVYNEVLNKVKGTNRRKLYSDKEISDLTETYGRKNVVFTTESIHEVAKMNTSEEVEKALGSEDKAKDDDMPF